MALTDASKLSIDVLKLGAIKLVTPALAKTQILKFYQPHVGKKSGNCPNVCESWEQFIRTNLFKSSNLLDSYYPKIIFSEPSLELLPEEKLKQNFPAVQ